MPYVAWLLRTLHEWDPGACPHSPAPAAFDWNDIDDLLGAAANAGVAWADPLSIVVRRPAEALITLDLPGGVRLCSLTEEVGFYQAPLEHPTLAVAVWHALTSVRETGERLAADLERFQAAAAPGCSFAGPRTQDLHFPAPRGRLSAAIVERVVRVK